MIFLNILPALINTLDFGWSFMFQKYIYQNVLIDYCWKLSDGQIQFAD